VRVNSSRSPHINQCCQHNTHSIAHLNTSRTHSVPPCLLPQIHSTHQRPNSHAWKRQARTCTGYWEPYQIEGTPDELVHRWGQATFSHLSKILHSPAAAAAGALHHGRVSGPVTRQ
jgi:hypothetical protein